MNEIKLKERFDKAANAFFDNENLSEDNSLTYAGEKSLLQENAQDIFTQRVETLVNTLKQVFFFFPGTLILFNVSLRFAVFTLNPTDGVEFTNPFLLIISALMTILGIGSFKNTKHIIIPLSIISFSIALGIAAEFLGDGLNFYYIYGIYFFPLALIIPFLAKGWVDKTEKE